MVLVVLLGGSGGVLFGGGEGKAPNCGVENDPLKFTESPQRRAGNGLSTVCV